MRLPLFADIADLLELKGENQFKIRAYQKAVRAIEHYPKEIRIMVDEGEDLKSIPGSFFDHGNPDWEWIRKNIKNP